jgi:hypothetical protein
MTSSYQVERAFNLRDRSTPGSKPRRPSGQGYPPPRKGHDAICSSSILRWDIRQHKHSPTVTCPYHSPAMRFVRNGSCASRSPLVGLSLVLSEVWSAPEAHSCASASYRIKYLPVVTSRNSNNSSRMGSSRVAIRAVPLSLLPVLSPVIHLSYAAVCPTCQSRRHIAGARGGEVISSAELCQCFGRVHPCSWHPLVDPCWTSLGAAEPGVCQV